MRAFQRRGGVWGGLIASAVACALAIGCVGEDSSSGPSSDAGGQGSEGAACFANGTCFGSLTCLSGLCVRLEGGASQDGAPSDASQGADASLDAPGNDALADGAPVDAAPDGGLTCATFCTAEQVTCTGTNQQYGDFGACMTACAGWPAGTAGATAGNSLACREYHRTAAAQGAASTHCPHTGPSGGGICA